MTDWDWTTIAAAGSVLALILGAIGYVWRHWVKPFIRKLALFLEDWNGEDARPGIPRRPGVIEQLAGVQAEQSRVSKELQTNGGSSIKDAVKRTEQGLSDVKAEQRAQKDILNTLAALVGGFVGQEQVARIEGHRAQSELFRTMQEINDNGGGQS